jgi:histidinol phosphatase-like enzyme
MGLKAKSNFPEIEFSKSVIVGDSISDMEFGKKLGMKTVFIRNGCDKIEIDDFCTWNHFSIFIKVK